MSTDMYVKVSLEVRVNDQRALKRAAARQAVREGLHIRDGLSTRVDAGDDLLMLIDPSCVTGCEIIESNADVDLFDDEEGRPV